MPTSSQIDLLRPQGVCPRGKGRIDTPLIRSLNFVAYLRRLRAKVTAAGECALITGIAALLPHALTARQMGA